MRNYRPISLLSVVSKVLESLVFNGIVVFVTNTISVHQFGFLRGRFTLQQLLIFFSTLLGSSSQTDVLYLDFKKALTLSLIMNFLTNFGTSVLLTVCGSG